MPEQQYAGFWVMVGAAVIDTIIIMMIISPILAAIYGKEYWLSDAFIQGTWDVLLNYIFPAIAVVIFWTFKSATPGKMLVDVVIVDAKTGRKPSIKQFIIRYLGYYVSLLPLGVGIFWVAFDRRKQGWHDKIAGTVVIQTNRSTLPDFEAD